MIVVFKRQRAVRLNAIREVQISARHQHQVALQRAILLNRSSPIDLGVKSIVSAKKFQRRAFGQQFGCGARHEKLRGVQFINHTAGIGSDGILFRNVSEQTPDAPVIILIRCSSAALDWRKRRIPPTCNGGSKQTCEKPAGQGISYA